MWWKPHDSPSIESYPAIIVVIYRVCTVWDKFYAQVCNVRIGFVPKAVLALEEKVIIEKELKLS